MDFTFITRYSSFHVNLYEYAIGMYIHQYVLKELTKQIPVRFKVNFVRFRAGYAYIETNVMYPFWRLLMLMLFRHRDTSKYSARQRVQSVMELFICDGYTKLEE